MACDKCGGSGLYNQGTYGSCRDDGDGWVYCTNEGCDAGYRRALKEGGTGFMIACAGGELLRKGEKLPAAQYASYKKSVEWMNRDSERFTLLPNN